MKKLTLSTGFLVAFALGASAYTDLGNNTLRSNGTSADTQAAINAAADGYIVQIPAGEFTWSSGVSISGKGVHLQGAGGGRIVGRSLSSVAVGTGTKTFTTQSGLPLSSGQIVRVINTGSGGNWMEGTVSSYGGTTLIVNVTAIGGGGTAGFWVIATNPQTIINNNAGVAVSVTEDTTRNVEVSGIRFIRGSSTASHVTITPTPGGRLVLVHDCWMSAGVSYKMVLSRSRQGVVYNCSFDATFNSAFPVVSVNAQAINVELDTGWNTPSTMGAADTDGTRNFYIEDNDFHGMNLQCIDMVEHARLVIRYNVFNHSCIVAHGKDTGPNGARHYEIYNNTMVYHDVGTASYAMPNGYFYNRGGTGVITDNDVMNIKSSYWGDPSEWVFILQAIRRAVGCYTTYPVAHQVGRGHNGISEITEPLYAWNNTGVPLSIYLSDYNPDECGNDQHTRDYIVAGRDYFMGVPKPGYTKFVYPHPLRGPVSKPSAPQNLRVVAP